MSHVRSFSPIAAKDARVLILGSMPGRASLEANEYYAHERNRFWPILGDVFGFDSGLPYEERCAALRTNRVAVWDVMQACFRPGSLDASIDESSIVPNEFQSFLDAHGEIERICFNGVKAEISYRKYVTPGLPEALAAIPAVRLPSTSPAHAAMSPRQKTGIWREALS